MKKAIYYYLIIALLFAFSANAQAPYCTISISTTEPITYVNFGSINNTTPNGSGQPPYENFTDLSTCVEPGQTYTIQLRGDTRGSYTNYFTVYIDWNQDNVFNTTTEAYQIGSITNSDGTITTLTGNITVPANAALGPTRMRVVKNYNAWPPGPCTNIAFGQAEDYTIYVGGGQPNRIGYTTVADPFNVLPLVHRDNATTNWSNVLCRGSGTSTSMPNLFNGVGYVAENESTVASCSPFLASAYMQAWGQGGQCNGYQPLGAVQVNAVSFLANYNGSHLLNISSNRCGSSSVNQICTGGLGFDGTGQSAALRYRQVTNIRNTTSVDTICIEDTKSITYDLEEFYNNPNVDVSIVQGAGLGTLSNNIFTATQSGLVTVRTRVGVVYDDVSFYVSAGAISYVPIIVCQSELPMTWNGINIPSSTVTGDEFLVSYPMPGECDSTSIAVLTVHPEYEFTLDTAICISELPLTLHNNTWDASTVAGDYTHTETYAGIGGCDSTHIVNLTIHPEYEFTLDTAICVSELPLTLHNNTWDASTVAGDYTHTEIYAGIGGCDSTHIVNLTIHPEPEFTLDTAICISELPLTLHNNTWDASTVAGDYTHTEIYAGIGGCDSTHIVNLTIHPEYEFTLDTAICVSELPVTIHNNTWDASTVAGDYTHTETYAGIGGCDSTHIVNLTIHPEYEFTLDTAICVSELPLTLHNNTWDASTVAGDYTHTEIYAGVGGCDSTHIVNLTIHPEPEFTLDTAICISELPLTLHNNTWDASTVAGDYTHTEIYAGIGGCDSMHIVNLTIHPEYEFTLDTAICVSELPVTIHNNTWDASTVAGDYTHTETYAGIGGCDSTHIVNLTIHPEPEFTLDTAICISELPLTLHNNTWDASTVAGDYTHTEIYAGVGGCDSTHIVNLTIHPEPVFTLDTAICISELPLTLHNNTWDASTVAGDYTHTEVYAGIGGCDSTHIVNLTIHPEYEFTLDTAICVSELPLTLHNNTWDASTVAGDYTHTEIYAGVGGCDSTHIVNLTIYPEYIIIVDTSVCASDLPVTIHNNTWDMTTLPGLYDHTYTYTGIGGCDSIYVVNLTIEEYLTSTLEESICDGEGYVFNGTTYTSAVTLQDNITDTFTTASCDSIVTLVLTVHPVYNLTVDTAICESDLPFTLHNNTWDFSTAPGNYTHTETYAGVGGCDSVYNVNLTIHPEYEYTIDTIVCVPDLPFTLHNNTWDASTAPGTYTHIETYAGVGGCDSTYIVNLTIPMNEILFDTTICQSDLPFSIHNNTWDASTVPGVYNHTEVYSGVGGCDSTYLITLNVLESYKGDADTTICRESLPFTWHGYTFNTVASASLEPGISYTASNGCDSVIVLHLDFYPEAVEIDVYESGCGSVTFEGEVYYHSTNFIDTFSNVAGCDSLIRSIQIEVHPQDVDYRLTHLENCDSVLYRGDTYYSSVRFIDTILSIHGCDSVINDLTIDVYHFDLNLSVGEDTIYRGEPLYFTTDGSEFYTVLSWTPTDLFPAQSATNQSVYFEESTTVQVTAQGSSGCMDSASIYIHVKDVDKTVIIPNAFTPNNDGLNDYFNPMLNIERAYTILEFSIYNRFGQRVFTNTGDYNRGWDGTYKGEPCPIGSYVYVLKVKFIDGEEFEQQGDVQLIR